MFRIEECRRLYVFQRLSLKIQVDPHPSMNTFLWLPVGTVIDVHGALKRTLTANEGGCDLSFSRLHREGGEYIEMYYT
jgi:hypothetical protein